MNRILSVIVPVYNTEKYLNKCIESIIDASNEDIEIILVNDGSTDSSGRICDEFARKNSNVKVVHQQNRGASVARRTGAEKSCGSYITFVDSDDWVEKNIYSEMLSKIKKHGVDVVICDMLREAQDGQIIWANCVEAGFYNRDRLEKEFFSIALFDFDACKPAVIPSLCNKIMKRDLFMQVSSDVDDSIVFGEDAICSFPAVFEVQSLYVLRKPLYHYRQNFESVSNVYNVNRLNEFLILCREFRVRLEKRNYNFMTQLSGYVSLYALLCIRNELLYDTDKSIWQRIKIVKKFVVDEEIIAAFKTGMNNITNKKVRTKIKLAQKMRFLTLYLIFGVKEKFLKRKKSRNG